MGGGKEKRWGERRGRRRETGRDRERGLSSQVHKASRPSWGQGLPTDGWSVAPRQLYLYTEMFVHLPPQRWLCNNASLTVDDTTAVRRLPVPFIIQSNRPIASTLFLLRDPSYYPKVIFARSLLIWTVSSGKHAGTSTLWREVLIYLALCLQTNKQTKSQNLNNSDSWVWK